MENAVAQGGVSTETISRVSHDVEERPSRPWSGWRRIVFFGAAHQLAILASVFVAFLFLGVLAPDDPRPGPLQLLVLLAPTTFLAFSLSGLYREPVDEAGLELRRITCASCTLFAIVILSQLGSAGEAWIFPLALTWLASLLLVPILQALARRLTAFFAGARERVLVVGNGPESQSLVHWLGKREPRLLLVGILEADSPFLHIEHALRTTCATHLVVAPDGQDNRDLMGRLRNGLCGFEQVTLIPRSAHLTSVASDRRVLGNTWGVALRPPAPELSSQWIKRTVDYALGIPLFLLSLPVMGVLALCIKIISPGPAFFRHKRIGHRGQVFDVFKLRSMCHDAEERLARHLSEDEEAQREWERDFKLKRDPRLLPLIGTFLRRTSLDELPQLLNVLRGEMSLVGPRPLPRYHMARMSTDFRRRRQSVLPGLTGLWQIGERNNGNPETVIRMDDHYLRNWSIWLDLRILAVTGWAVLTGRGAH